MRTRPRGPGACALWATVLGRARPLAALLPLALLPLALLPLAVLALPPAARVAWGQAAVPMAKPPAPAGMEAELELSLGDAIRMALDSNRNVGIARRRVGMAENRLSEAKGGLYPRVTLDAATQQRDQPPIAHFGALKVPQGDLYTTTTRTALVMPLFDLRVYNATDAAAAAVDIARLTSERTEEDIVLQVSQSYYRVLQALKIREVVLDSIASVQLQVNDARAFYKQGLVANSDVLSAEVRLAERQQDLITAEANLQVSQASLNRVLGQDLGRKLKLKDVTGRPQWSGNYDALVQTAHQSRVDLKAARLQIVTSEADLAATRADNWPRLNAYAEYDTNSTSLFLHKEWTATGLSVSMTLFSGGAQSAAVERKQKELLEAQDQFLERQDNISLDVKQAYLAAGQTYDSVQVAEKNRELATENLRILRDRYTQGLVTSTDVLAAEDASSRARANFYQTLYDFYAALARLDNAVGHAK